MKKHIALIVAIILLAGGAFVTQQWFVQTYGTEQQAAAITFTAETGGTVLDAMNTRMASGELSFTGRDFPGLGFFVEEINGRGNADGHYWILYVNGTSSQTGASATTLSRGDAIEWRYEKGY